MKVFGTNGSRLSTRRRRSFADLALDAGACVEDELNILTDDHFAWPGPGCLGTSIGNNLGGRFPAEDHVPEGERERALTSFLGFEQDRLGSPNCATGFDTPDIPRRTRLVDAIGQASEFNGEQQRDQRASSSLAATQSRPNTAPPRKAAALPHSPPNTEALAQLGSALQPAEHGKEPEPQAQAALPDPSTGHTPTNEAKAPKALVQLAQLVGRGWARDRRAWMEKALGGGLGLLKSS
jgi:hypothetical protein